MLFQGVEEIESCKTIFEPLIVSRKENSKQAHKKKMCVIASIYHVDFLRSVV